jgi:hypothetical protein
MTHLCVVAITFARFLALRSPDTIRTSSFVAQFSSPPQRARTVSVDIRAFGTILASASLGTIQTVLTLRTYIQTLFPHETRLTFTFSCYVMARGTIVTPTRLRALFAPEPERTAIGAYRTRPTWLAEAFSRFGIASAAVLTSALRFAFAAVFSHGTRIVTSGSVAFEK